MSVAAAVDGSCVVPIAQIPGELVVAPPTVVELLSLELKLSVVLASVAPASASDSLDLIGLMLR